MTDEKRELVAISTMRIPLTIELLPGDKFGVIRGVSVHVQNDSFAWEHRGTINFTDPLIVAEGQLAIADLTLSIFRDAPAQKAAPKGGI